MLPSAWTRDAPAVDESDQQIEQCRVSAQRDALAETVLRQAAYQIDRQQHEAGKAETPPSRSAVVQPNYRRCDQQAGNQLEQCSADFDLCYQNCGGAIDLLDAVCRQLRIADFARSFVAPSCDETLIKALVRAHRWRRRIECGQARSVTDLADQEGVTDAYVCRLLPLTCLAPDIVEAILDGQQPRGLRVAEVPGNGPLVWEEQRDFWGFSRCRNGPEPKRVGRAAVPRSDDVNGVRTGRPQASSRDSHGALCRDRRVAGTEQRVRGGWDRTDRARGQGGE